MQLTAPSITASVPAAHGSQLCAPSAAEKRPTGHGVQRSDGGQLEIWPAGHLQVHIFGGRDESTTAVQTGACTCAGAAERGGAQFALAPNVRPAALHARQALLRAVVGHVPARRAAAAQAASRHHQAGWADDAQADATTHLFTAQPDGSLAHADHLRRNTHHILRAARILDIHVPPRCGRTTAAAAALFLHPIAVCGGEPPVVCGLERVTRQLVVDRQPFVVAQADDLLVGLAESDRCGQIG